MNTQAVIGATQSLDTVRSLTSQTGNAASIKQSAMQALAARNGVVTATQGLSFAGQAKAMSSISGASQVRFDATQTLAPSKPISAIQGR